MDNILEDTTHELQVMTHSKILEPDALTTSGDSLYLETMLLRMEEMEVRSGLQVLVVHGAVWWAGVCVRGGQGVIWPLLSAGPPHAFL